MRQLIISVILVWPLVAAGRGNPPVAAAVAASEALASADGTLLAVVAVKGKEKGAAANESRVEIRRRGKTLLRAHDFSSSDGEYGYYVDGARWTPDSRFFVFRMRSSGGHSPMWAPVVFWSRRTNRFYQVNDYTADIAFSVISPDKVTLSTWPDMKPATISLFKLGPSQTTKLR
jgi:hypothetical protein